MVFERINGLPAPVRKNTGHVGPVLIGPIAINHSPTAGVKPPQRIEDDAQMPHSSLFTSSSSSRPLRRSPRRNGVLSFDDDLSSSESSSVVEITIPKRSPAKNPVKSSRKHPISSKHRISSISSSQPPSTPNSRVRVEVGPFLHPTNKATSILLPTVPPRSSSDQPFSVPISDKPSVSKKPEIRHHAPPGTQNASNPKSQHRHPFPPDTLEASTPRVDDDGLPVLRYDLDMDPTEDVYEVHHQFHERSPHFAMLSARFIHAHLSNRLSGSATSNDELITSTGDLMTEFIEPAAIGSVGPHHEVTPSYSVNSVEIFGDSPPPPGGGGLDLEDTVQVTDPFAVLTMDDVINQPSAIDPSVLGGTSAFSETLSPSLGSTTFRDFPLWEKAQVPPSPLNTALAIRVPPHPSTSGSNSAKTLGESVGNLGGGKAKFYKKGTLQTPPHLSNPQSRTSWSAKVAPSTYAGRYPSPDQIVSQRMDSPLTEFSVPDLLANGTASTSSVATPSEAADAVEEESTDGGSSTSPRLTSVKTATAREQKRRMNEKTPYRIIAVNEKSYCHQCRNSTTHPKMHCRACPKHYCIMCIVKRYHDIEFHQFKKDFDCPACLNKCNCTSCCEKRNEVYVTTRHIKFDASTTAKLLSGEIRSLPHLSTSFPGARKGLKPGQDRQSSRYRELPSTVRKTKAPTRQKRATSRRYASDDDEYDEGDTSKAQSASTRVKPTQAALQTQKMLEESGSGRYWGAVYSLSGERIGKSYVGNNLQNVTVQSSGFSSLSIRDYPTFPRRRVYVGRWQDAWGPHPEISDDSYSEGETHANQRSRSRKDLGRARSRYVGNQSIIKSWWKSQSRNLRSPLVSLPPCDGTDVYAPSSDPLPFDLFCTREAIDPTPNAGIPIDEDEDNIRDYWAMEDGLSPEESNPPYLASTNVSRPGLGNINDVIDICSSPILESCELVPQQALAEAVASSLEAVGTAVLLPQSHVPLPTFSC